MKKIVFGITSLDVGGAERVLVDLVNRLCKDYDITILTIYENGELEKEVNNKIKLISIYPSKYKDLSIINKKFKSLLFSSSLYLKYLYNKYLKDKYDLEIAFLEGPITSLFAQSSSTNKIAWVHTDISKHLINNIRKKQADDDYQKYSKIVFVSKDSLDGFNRLFKIDVMKLIIHNYMDVDLIINKAKLYNSSEIIKQSGIPVFLTVCRLVKVKAIDRLILVSKKLLENGYNHKFYIVGDGPEHEMISTLIDNFEMKDNFILLGQKGNPYPYMKKTDYFVLPSLYEGYPMVLVEAMSLEKNIIITDTGAREVLDSYDNKLIVDNSFDGLYDGLKKVISGKKKFSKDIKVNYYGEKILKQIIKLIEGDQ